MIIFNEDKNDSIKTNSRSHQLSPQSTRVKDKKKKNITRRNKKIKLSKTNSEFLKSLGFELKK